MKLYELRVLGWSLALSLLTLGRSLNAQRYSPVGDFELDSLSSQLTNELSVIEEVRLCLELGFGVFQAHPDSAALLYDRASSLLEVEDLAVERAWLNWGEANLAALLSRISEADSLYQLSLAEFRSLGRPDGEARALHGLGTIYQRSARIDSAKLMLEEAEVLSRQMEDPVLRHNVLYSLGNCLRRLQRYDDALEKLLAAIEVARTADYPAKQALSHSSIARIYSLQGDNERALEELDKAIRINKELGAKRTLAANYQNQGIFFQALGRIDDGITALEKSLELKRGLGDDRSTTLALGQLGNLYRALEEYDQAEVYYREGLELLPVADFQTRFGLHYALASSYFERGNKRASRAEFLRAKELLEAYDMEDHRPELYKAIAQVDTSLGDFQSAFYWFGESTRIKDSLVAESNEQKLNELMTQYGLQEKENELALLAAENEVVQLQAQQQSRNFRWALLSLLLLAGLLGYLLFQGQQLRRKEQDLSQSVREKETLLREIHHRVKNNMQLITSLLNLQAKKGADLDIKEFLFQGESRVKSMSLIHERLYQQDNMSTIELGSYLEALIQQNFRAANLDEAYFKFTLDAHDIDLDISQAIPVGLIMNELIWNSIKHGFLDRAEGHLRLEVKRSGQEVEVGIADDGPGFKAAEKVEGLGLELVNLLARQLNGSFVWVSNPQTTGLLRFAQQPFASL